MDWTLSICNPCYQRMCYRLSTGAYTTVLAAVESVEHDLGRYTCCAVVDYLMPFLALSILRAQCCNMVQTVINFEVPSCYRRCEGHSAGLCLYGQRTMCMCCCGVQPVAVHWRHWRGLPDSPARSAMATPALTGGSCQLSWRSTVRTSVWTSARSAAAAGQRFGGAPGGTVLRALLSRHACSVCRGQG